MTEATEKWPARWIWVLRMCPSESSSICLSSKPTYAVSEGEMAPEKKNKTMSNHFITSSACNEMILVCFVTAEEKVRCIYFLDLLLR